MFWDIKEKIVTTEDLEIKEQNSHFNCRLEAVRKKGRAFGRE
jgi:hypothetical protein